MTVNAAHSLSTVGGHHCPCPVPSRKGCSESFAGGGPVPALTSRACVHTRPDNKESSPQLHLVRGLRAAELKCRQPGRAGRTPRAARGDAISVL